MLCELLSELVGQFHQPSEAMSRGLVVLPQRYSSPALTALDDTNISEHPLSSRTSATRYHASYDCTVPEAIKRECKASEARGRRDPWEWAFAVSGEDQVGDCRAAREVDWDNLSTCSEQVC